jgi:hypothetical protein
MFWESQLGSLPDIAVTAACALAIPRFEQDIEINRFAGLNEHSPNPKGFSIPEPLIAELHVPLRARFAGTPREPVINSRLKQWLLLIHRDSLPKVLGKSTDCLRETVDIDAD